jgi:hypothetical protein
MFPPADTQLPPLFALRSTASVALNVPKTVTDTVAWFAGIGNRTQAEELKFPAHVAAAAVMSPKVLCCAAAGRAKKSSAASKMVFRIMLSSSRRPYYPAMSKHAARRGNRFRAKIRPLATALFIFG